MARCKNFILSLFIFCTVPAIAISNYRATYDIEVRGIDAGSITHEVIFTPNSYRIDTAAKPSLLAASLGYGDIRETTKGLLISGNIQPQTYQRTIKGKPEDNLYYIFKPETHQVEITADNNTKNVGYAADKIPLDTLSMVAQSIINIENNTFPTQYTLVMEDEIRSYKIGEKEVQTWHVGEGKEIDVQIYRQTHSNKETLIYFADNPLRLVRLEQYRKGKRRFSINLIDYKILQ